MAGLGIGAGAFEGDTQRTAERQRDDQLAIQRASLAQQAAQASDNNRRSYAQMAMQERSQQRAIDAQMAMQERSQQRAIDAQMETQQRQQAFAGDLDARHLEQQQQQFDVTQEAARGREAFNQNLARVQLDRQDTMDQWTIAGKQLEMRQNQALLSKYTAANAAETEKIANRKKMAQSNMGAFLQSMVMNGGVASSESLSLLNQGLGLSGGSEFVKAYGTTDAGFVMTTRDGRAEPVDMQMYSAAVKTLLGDEYDTSGKPHQSTQLQTAYDRQASQGQKLDPISSSRLKVAEMKIQKWQETLSKKDPEMEAGAYKNAEANLTKAYDEYEALIGGSPVDRSVKEEEQPGRGGIRSSMLSGQNGTVHQNQEGLYGRINSIGLAVWEKDPQLSLEMQNFVNKLALGGAGEQQVYDAFIKQYSTRLSGLGRFSNKR